MPLSRLRAPATTLAALIVSIPCTVAAEAPSDTASAGGPIEEIVVTARKRTETLQDTPVAVTAVTADQIEDYGIQSLADISKMTAGLLFDSEFTRGANRPVIRGQANILGASGVSYFIDGVYISGAIDDYDLNDVERVEIVKGPQSALYGRNTYSGAINLVTRSPADEMRAAVEAQMAGDEEYLVRASISGPISDTVAGGLTLRHYEMGGHVTNQFDGTDIGEQQSRSIAGMLALTPNERLSIRTRAYFSEREDGQPALIATRRDDNNCFQDNGGFYGGANRYYCGTIEPGHVNIDWPIQAPDAGINEELMQLSLKLDYQLNENWALTYIGGYGDRDVDELYDADYSPTSFHATPLTPRGIPLGGPVWGWVGFMVDFTFDTVQSTRDVSHELQLSFDLDRVSGMVGVYSLGSDFSTRDDRELTDAQRALGVANQAAVGKAICDANPACFVVVPLFAPNISVSRNSRSLDIENRAAFAMVSFDLTDEVGLTLEGRFQDEDIATELVAQSLGSPPGDPVSASDSFDGFLPRVTLDWRPTADHLLYLTYAEGTKPGGFNDATAIQAGLPTFDEEDATSIELGLKSVLADGRLFANLALFFNEVAGYQLTQNVQFGARASSAIVNAGDADITGIEAELAFAPTDELTLRLNYAWTDAAFTAGFDQNEGALLDYADDALANCSTGDQFPDVAGCQSRFGSIEGKQVPRTSEHQAFADLEYRRAMNGGWEWYGGLSYIYESSKFAQVHNLAETGDVSMLNVRLGLVNDRYSVRVFGRNLTGEESAYTVLRYLEAATYGRAFVVAPRRDTYFGVSLTMEL